MTNDESYRAVVAAFTTGDVSRFPQLVADDFKDHLSAPSAGKNRDGFRAFVSGLRTVFPDLRAVVEDVFVDGDKIAARLTIRGTHRRAFAGVPATNRKIAVSVVEIVRFGVDGKWAERWGVFDQLGMLQQMGAFPSK